MVQIRLENRFAAPPAFVQTWLTDFREDDPQRWFEGKTPARILERSAGRTVLESENPMGTSRTEVTVETPTRWTAKSVTRRGETVVMESRIVETVEPDGAAGTIHRVVIDAEPRTFGARLTLTFGKPMFRRMLLQAFGRMKPEIEREAAAAKAAPVVDGLVSS